MANICTAPREVNSFFTRIYGALPEVSQVKRDTLCSLANREISVRVDSFGGCHVDIVSTNQKGSFEGVQKAIEELAQELKENRARDSLWVNFSLPMNPAIIGSVLPESFEIGIPGKGDLINDLQQKKIRIWQWLNPDKECTIPAGATHNIGATGLFWDPNDQKILMVVPVRRNKDWNLPGGSFDLSKDERAVDTALREAEEEAGFRFEDKPAIIKSARLIGQMQFPQNQFASAINQVWSFIVPGLSQQVKLNPPPDEIQRAEWINCHVITDDAAIFEGFGLSKEIKAFCLAAINGLGSQEVVNKGWIIAHAPVKNG